MKVILEPKVRIVGKTLFIPHEEYEIPDDGTDAEKLGAFAAKGCYDSYGKKGRSNTENQKAILEHAHGSVMEHSHVSLFIEGITRGLSLELNRHRPFNISQRSTRYTREEDSAIVLEPEYSRLFVKHDMWRAPDGKWFPRDPRIDLNNLTPTTEQNMLRDFLDDCEHAIAAYKKQVDYLEKLNPNKLTGFDLRKWARGKARNLLPHGLETRGTWTNNYRGYRWFIESRSNRHAEPEIRVLAHHVLTALKDLAPVYFADFTVAEVVDGIPEWVPTYHKV